MFFEISVLKPTCDMPENELYSFQIYFILQIEQHSEFYSIDWEKKILLDLHKKHDIQIKKSIVIRHVKTVEHNEVYGEETF